MYVKEPFNCIGTAFYIGPKTSAVVLHEKTRWKPATNEIKQAYYGITLDDQSKTKVYVQRHDIEYPISKEHMKHDADKDKTEENKEDEYVINDIHDSFKIIKIFTKNY